MGLYIKATTGASKQDFVSAAGVGADLVTAVELDEVAIFVGPDSPGNFNEVVTGLRQCVFHLRERIQSLSPGPAELAAASVVAGAGQAAVTSEAPAATLDDGDVAVIYGGVAFDQSASIFLTNTANQLIEGWMETVGKLS